MASGDSATAATSEVPEEPPTATAAPASPDAPEGGEETTEATAATEPTTAVEDEQEAIFPHQDESDESLDAAQILYAPWDESNPGGVMQAVETAATGQVAGVGSTQLEKDEVWILWDTGSDGHFARGRLAETGTRCEDQGPPMEDAQGNSIGEAGTVRIRVGLDDNFAETHDTTLVMRNSEALRDNIVSAGKMVKRGSFRAVLDSEGSYLQRKDNPQVYVPLYMRQTAFTSRQSSRTVSTRSDSR